MTGRLVPIVGRKIPASPTVSMAPPATLPLKPKSKIGRSKPNGAISEPPWITREPPAHLSADARAWWRAVEEDFALEPHHMVLLTAAGEFWDRANEARKVIKEQGAYVADRFGQMRVHPAVGVERDARLGFVRVMHELGLDVDEPRSPGRPPTFGNA